MTDDGHGGYGLVNHFKLDGDDLVFVDKDSANFVYVKVQDGEKFNCTGEAFKQNDTTAIVSLFSMITSVNAKSAQRMKSLSARI